MVRPITQRKLDLVYLTFFIVHVPVMLLVDLAPWYPQSLRPAVTVQIRNFYIETYRDRFFIDPPAWFWGYTLMEMLYHIPLSLWAVPALINDNPQVSVQLLIFAVQTAITTLTCTVEMLSWEGYSRAEQLRLCGLYVPYLLLAVVMIVDMQGRLKRAVGVKNKVL